MWANASGSGGIFGGPARASLSSAATNRRAPGGGDGLADLTGARVLAKIGDDRDRFADDRARKAYAGSAPVTRASGT
jgi:Transposase IS116/IS110/IS902 family